MKINDIIDNKLIQIYKTKKKRGYLGVSSIGDECAR